ncbi:MAG TPA: hypothetical protein VH500_14490 [Nitrososphaeraceae archaeon]|jgi:hypothetical protein
MIFDKLDVRRESQSKSIQIMMLAFAVTAMLLCATSFQGVSAQNQSSTNSSNSNNSSNSANLSASGKTVVIPQGNKATITTGPTAASQTNNSQGNNRTGFTSVSNLVVKDKTFPIKYNMTKGKLLGIVGDKDKTTLVFILGGTSDNGKLSLEIPRNVLDAKSQGNTDTKYNVRIDNKGVDYKELATNLNARILQIGFNKDDRVLEIAGTQMAS